MDQYSKGLIADVLNSRRAAPEGDSGEIVVPNYFDLKAGQKWARRR